MFTLCAHEKPFVTYTTADGRTYQIPNEKRHTAQFTCALLNNTVRRGHHNYLADVTLIALGVYPLTAFIIRQDLELSDDARKLIQAAAYLDSDSTEVIDHDTVPVMRQAALEALWFLKGSEADSAVADEVHRYLLILIEREGSCLR